MDVPYITPFPGQQRAAAYRARVRSAAASVPASRWYMIFLGLTMATGGVVLFEPAPIDVLLMVMLLAGLALGKLAFVPAHEAPLVLLAVFLGANVISLIHAEDMEWALRYFAITAYLVLSWVFFTGVLTRHGYRAARVLMNGYTVGGLVSAMVGVLSYLHIIGHQELFLLFGRPRGLFKDPNVYGPYMVPVLIWAIVRLQASTRMLVKLWWTGSAMVASAAIFFSFSRGCWINCAVSVAAYFVLDILSGGLNARKLAKVGGTAALVAVVAVVVGVIVVNADPHLGWMLQQRLGYGGVQAYDVSHRFYAQDLAMKSVRAKPLGIGPGQMEVNYLIATHSMYLRVLVENGLLGFLAMYTMVALTVIRMLRLALRTREPRWRGLFVMVAACTAGMLVNGLAIDTNHWREMWLLLALVWVSPPAEAAAVEQPGVLNMRGRALAGGRPV